MAPAALLVILAIIGLLGVRPHPQWNGTHATVAGLALEVVLAALLIATFRRGHADETQVAGKLRLGLKYLLAVAMIALALAMIVNLHLHLSSHYRSTPRPRFTQGLPRAHKAAPPGSLPAWLPYLLLALALIAAIAAVIKLRFRYRLRKPALRPPRGSLALDPESLRDALSEGAAALRSADYDDARRAIIACYVAMERSLTANGAEKTDTDTPTNCSATPPPRTSSTATPRAS